eukprot:475082-Pyramimonas_sp.AAC.1
MQELNGLRAGGCFKVTLAETPRALVLKLCNVSRIEGRSVSKGGSRLSAAHIRLTSSKGGTD